MSAPGERRKLAFPFPRKLAVDAGSVELFEEIQTHADRLVRRLDGLRFLPEFLATQLVQEVDLPLCAASFGRVDVLEWLDTRPEGTHWTPELLYHATLHRQGEAARWLLADRPECCEYAFSDSVKHALSAHDHELVQRMLGFQPSEGTPDLMDYAALCGDLEAVVTMHDQGVACTTRAMDDAARVGNVALVQFLHEHRKEGCTTNAMDEAAPKNHLRVVRFLHEQRSEGCTKAAMDSAARAGHLDVVRFLHENRNEGCTVDAMDGAAQNGFLKIVQFLQANRTEGCSEEALIWAAKNGHLEIVQFLKDTYGLRISGTDGVVSSALWNGHAKVGKYLRSVVPSPILQYELEDVATYGHLHLVRFLLEGQGVRFMEKVLSNARKSRNAELVQFLEAHRSVSRPT